MRASGERVLVVGLDSADWRVLRPLLDAGALPVLALLIRDGAAGDLASTIHPHSPTAWSSFLTGMNPGRHGVFDFLQRKPGSYEFEVVTTRSRGGRPIWQLLSERGIGCGIVNVPMTYPPEKVAGFFLSGTFSSNPLGNVAWPRDILDDLARRLGRPYRVDTSYEELRGANGEGEEATLARFRDRLNEIEEDRVAATLHLMERHAPRFVVHVVTSIDRAQHTFWRWMDASGPAYDPAHPLRGAIEETYRVADRALGRLVDAAGPDAAVIVMSDHGAGALRRVLFLNTWLEREGWLATEQPAALSRRALARGAYHAARGAARSLLPRGVRRRLGARLDAGGRTSIRFASPTTIDWARTRAVGEGTFGSIRLNVRGREPLGTVSPGAESDALRAEIRSRLEALVDPATGERAVERVYFREELYEGDRTAAAPDLVAALREGYQMIGDVTAHQYGGRRREFTVFGTGDANRYRLSGIHGPTGILVARGPGVAPGTRIAGARIIDLAPTILARFGLTPPPSMDGRVLDALVENAPAPAVARAGGEAR